MRINILFLIISSLVCVGCTSNGNLSDLDSDSKPTFTPIISDIAIIPQNKTVVFGQSFSFSVSGGGSKLKYSVLQGVSSINPNTGVFTASSTIETVLVKVSDENGKMAVATVLVNAPLSISSTPYEVYSQSQWSYDLPSPSGGVPNYQYSLFSGLGSITGTTYSPPGTAGTAVVKITDDSSTSVSLNLNIRSFQEKLRIDSGATISTGYSVRDGVEVGSDLLVYATVAPPSSGYSFYDVAKINSSISFFKTNDNGSTWTYVSNYQFREDRASYASRLLKSGSKLYLVGYSHRYFLSGLLNYRYESFIAESSDSGVTWVTKSTYLDSSPYESTSFLDAVITNDNSIILAGYSSSAASDDKNVFLRRCSLTTWDCQNSFESYTNNSTQTNDIKAIARDGIGNIYAVRNYYDTDTFSNKVMLKKSTDNGMTWSSIPVYNQDKMNTIAVSDDGQTIVVAGTTWVQPASTHVTYDGGTTWTHIVGTTNACNGWSFDKVIINSTTNEALGGCYNYSSGYTYYIKRLPYLATTWTTQATISGANSSNISVKADGTVLFSLGLGYPLYVTSNFGTTFSTPSLPTRNITTDAELMGILPINSTTLFTSGFIGTSTAGQKKGVIYKSTDSGATWNVNYTTTDTSSYISSMARSPTTGTLVAVGRTATAKWLSLRDSGGGWVTAETEVFPATAYNASPKKVFSGVDGRFVSVGQYWNSIGGASWYVKLSSNDGATWSALDTYRYHTSGASLASDGLIDGTDIWVVGYGVDGSGVSHWLVRKHNGTAWTVEDDFVIPPSEGVETRANGITKTSDGTLYVVGEYTKLNAYRTWVVRRKLPGASTTWETVDTFQMNSNGHSAATTVTELNGRVFVAGVAEASGGALKTTIRALMNNVWTTVDQSGTYSNSDPREIVPCLSNQLCLAGRTTNTDWQYLGLVRILTP
jgi:hypothetical protein